VRYSISNRAASEREGGHDLLAGAGLKERFMSPNLSDLTFLQGVKVVEAVV